MLSELLMYFYADCEEHTTQEMYDYFEDIYGECDKCFQHTLRGLQQGLKKRNIIHNVSRGVWSA